MLQLSTNSKKQAIVNIILIQYGNLKLDEWPIPCVAIYPNAKVSKQAHLVCILGLTHISCSFEQPGECTIE